MNRSLTTLNSWTVAWTAENSTSIWFKPLYFGVFCYISSAFTLIKMLSKSQFGGTSLLVQWLRIHLPMHGSRVQPLVGELRSHTLWGNLCPCATNYRALYGACVPQLERNLCSARKISHVATKTQCSQK